MGVKMSKIKYKKRKLKSKKIKRVLRGLWIVMVLFLISAITILSVFSISEVEVTGNSYYTAEQITEVVMDDLYIDNYLLLSWIYRSGVETNELPLISEIEIERTGNHSVNLRVYEKTLLGYIDYLGTYMYFDTDGIIVESSQEVIADVPLVTGLSFSSVTLYARLPVEQEGVFDTILTLTQLIKDAEIVPDKIYFDSDLNMKLYFDNTKVDLGTDENLELKVSRLKTILPDLEGLSGTLHMEHFTEGTKNITFSEE